MIRPNLTSFSPPNVEGVRAKKKIYLYEINLRPHPKRSILRGTKGERRNRLFLYAFRSADRSGPDPGLSPDYGDARPADLLPIYVSRRVLDAILFPLPASSGRGGLGRIRGGKGFGFYSSSIYALPGVMSLSPLCSGSREFFKLLSL
ncbi:hypothetical protein Trydic_g8786 [Trypoxylus dichotomus]